MEMLLCSGIHFLLFYKKFMEPRKTDSERNQQGGHEHPLPNEISKKEKETAIQAHNEAEKDMNEDAELTAHSPNDDLDEGETARLGEDTSDSF
jgi:hypothetical protein